MLPSRYFYDLTQPEIAGQLKKNPLVILPCGSVEQHALKALQMFRPGRVNVGAALNWPSSVKC